MLTSPSSRTCVHFLTLHTKLRATAIYAPCVGDRLFWPETFPPPGLAPPPRKQPSKDRHATHYIDLRSLFSPFPSIHPAVQRQHRVHHRHQPPPGGHQQRGQLLPLLPPQEELPHGHMEDDHVQEATGRSLRGRGWNSSHHDHQRRRGREQALQAQHGGGRREQDRQRQEEGGRRHRPHVQAKVKAHCLPLNSCITYSDF